MNVLQDDYQRAVTICNCNTDAVAFLRLWVSYVHAIDDVVDGDKTDADHVIKTSGPDPAMLFSHPFYLQHLLALRQIVLTTAQLYALSVRWEKAPALWKREFANCLRHSGLLMIGAIADICGGHEHALKMLESQWEICYAAQHPETQPKEVA